MHEHPIRRALAAGEPAVGFLRGLFRRDRSLLPRVHEVSSAAAVAGSRERDFELYRNVVSMAYQFHDEMLGTLLKKPARTPR